MTEVTPTEFLKRPYQRCVVPDTDGSYRAEIVEFPGCIATGETGSEALANLEDAAASWIKSTIASGLEVPNPIDDGAGFSGKLMLRLPKSLHKRAVYAAARDGISLNQFIVLSVAEQVGSRATFVGTTYHTGTPTYFLTTPPVIGSQSKMLAPWDPYMVVAAILPAMPDPSSFPLAKISELNNARR